MQPIAAELPKSCLVDLWAIPCRDIGPIVDLLTVELGGCSCSEATFLCDTNQYLPRFIEMLMKCSIFCSLNTIFIATHLQDLLLPDANSCSSSFVIRSRLLVRSWQLEDTVRHFSFGWRQRQTKPELKDRGSFLDFNRNHGEEAGC